MTIPIGKYMHAEHLGMDPEIYTIHARDKSILGHAEWYPRWRGYVFSPEDGIVLSWDCCLELSRFLENCNKAERICRRVEPEQIAKVKEVQQALKTSGDEIERLLDELGIK